MLDEAQNTSRTRRGVAQSKAARSLSTPRHRFALTGTPVENRLDDLWSIMQSRQPRAARATSLVFRELGSLRVRSSEATTRPPSERSANGSRPTVPAPAHQVPTPSILPATCRGNKVSRPTSSAPSPSSRPPSTKPPSTPGDGRPRAARTASGGDGPECWCSLTRAQADLRSPYSSLYLHERGPLVERSGKLDRLAEMISEAVSEVLAARFSHYAVMGRLLRGTSTSTSRCERLFLDGSTPRTSPRGSSTGSRSRAAGRRFRLSLPPAGSGST